MNKLFLLLLMLYIGNTSTAQTVGTYKIDALGYFYGYYIFVELSGTKKNTLYALSPNFSQIDSINLKKMKINNTYELVLRKVNSENKIRFIDKPRFTLVDGYAIDGKLINIGDTVIGDLYLILNASGEYIQPIDKKLLEDGTLWEFENE